MYVNSGAEGSRAQRTYTRGDEWDFQQSISPDFLVQLAGQWKQIEEHIAAFQEQKKALLAAVRSRHGRHEAEAIRVAMRLVLMDERKRTEQQKFNAAGERYAEIILEAREADPDGD